MFAELKTAVTNLAQAEFDGWVKEGRFDHRVIDGEDRFMSSSVANLFFRYPELEPRRMPARSTANLEKALLETCRQITSAAREQKTPYVLPKRFHVTMTVTAKPNALTSGKNISAWLPIPRNYPFQNQFQLVSSSPSAMKIAPPESPIRSVYLEQPAREKQETKFKLVYDYTASGVRFQVDPAKVIRERPDDPGLRPYLQEAPHVVFSQEIRKLSEEIAGQETNPYLKAKKFYDWIASQIKYSYAIEYSTIRNISEYCRTKGYGDCGQEALLFITLCRANGIPARWQSGWNLYPGDKTIHDWSEIYIAPYGWMPVDPYRGIFAMRYATHLSKEEKKEVSNFYFGGLDQYRMSANSDHSQPLSPPKKSMRSDDVDFQRGELESGTNNIYFDKYSWDLQFEELPVPKT
jgi:transglutaminase-like putative cysteine protease